MYINSYLFHDLLISDGNGFYLPIHLSLPGCNLKVIKNGKRYTDNAKFKSVALGQNKIDVRFFHPRWRRCWLVTDWVHLKLKFWSSVEKWFFLSSWTKFYQTYCSVEDECPNICIQSITKVVVLLTYILQQENTFLGIKCNFLLSYFFLLTFYMKRT